VTWPTLCWCGTYCKNILLSDVMILRGNYINKAVPFLTANTLLSFFFFRDAFAGRSLPKRIPHRDKNDKLFMTARIIMPQRDLSYSAGDVNPNWKLACKQPAAHTEVHPLSFSCKAKCRNMPVAMKEISFRHLFDWAENTAEQHVYSITCRPRFHFLYFRLMLLPTDNRQCDLLQLNIK